MRVLVTASAHFVITPDGTLWTSNTSLSYRFWRRYLEVFDAVDLLVRAARRSNPPAGWKAATGAGITALPLPEFVGPVGFVQNRPRIGDALRRALADAQAILLRVPCVIGGAMWRMIPPGRPFGVEVVADPYDTFAPGSVRHPLRAFFRWWFTRQLRLQCQSACAAAYVTAEALQQRYVCPAYTVGFSDVELPSGSFVTSPRPSHPNGKPFTLIT